MRFIFDFQLASVRPEMWWWPTGMLTLRSLILAILVSALPAGSIWLPLLIVMLKLLVVTLLLHTHYHPYVYYHTGDNYLETVMITHALLAFFAQIIVDALNFTGSDASLAPSAGPPTFFICLIQQEWLRLGTLLMAHLHIFCCLARSHTVFPRGCVWTEQSRR